MATSVARRHSVGRTAHRPYTQRQSAYISNLGIATNAQARRALLQFQERLTVYRIEALRHVPHATMLRVMGDSALILSGLFPRHSHRALVSPRFYIATGQMAYRQLANVDIHWNWAEASVAFPVLVDTLLALPATCPLDEWTASKYADFSRIAQRYVAIHNITVGNNLAV